MKHDGGGNWVEWIATSLQFSDAQEELKDRQTAEFLEYLRAVWSSLTSVRLLGWCEDAVLLHYIQCHVKQKPRAWGLHRVSRGPAQDFWGHLSESPPKSHL